MSSGMPGAPREADVCIVGAGAVGGIMAAELARRRVEVVVLESGPRHDIAMRPEYTRRFLRGENPWRTPIPEIDRYTTTGPVPYQLEWHRARGVGGSTLHWEGYALRFHADDFRLRTLHGVGDDWPISYQDLEPYYGRAERALGVAGEADDPWASGRSTRYPLPAFPWSFSDRLFSGACEKLGIGLQHLPQARNSIAYGSRSQCHACGTCHVCPIGAKASVDLTHFPEAEATGRVRVLANATALRIELDRPDLASRVVYAGADRRPRSLAARLFVLAAGAVENARLLLLSASTAHPRGLSNSSGLVGKSFTSHPTIDVAGRVTERVFPYRTGFSTAMARQFAVGRERAGRAGFFLQFLNSAGLTPAGIAVTSGQWGRGLRDHIRAEFGHTLGIRIYCEQLPDVENTLSLSPHVKDYFGNPAPHITYRIGAYEQRALAQAVAVARDILRTLGATNLQAGGLGFAAHQIATHRMGVDSRSSVVGPDLRAHDVGNLYVVGSGDFVTASPSPPTLTIAALAIRAAEHVAVTLGRGATAKRPF
jgi:choline dehydrogenase-like flavoprotein